MRVLWLTVIETTELDVSSATKVALYVADASRLLVTVCTMIRQRSQRMLHDMHSSYPGLL
jgi:hypothetical protein